MFPLCNHSPVTLLNGKDIYIYNSDPRKSHAHQQRKEVTGKPEKDRLRG